MAQSRVCQIRTQGARGLLAALALSCAVRLGSCLTRTRDAEDPRPLMATEKNSPGRCVRPAEQLQHALERQRHVSEGAMLKQQVTAANAFWPFGGSHGKKKEADTDAGSEATDASDTVEIAIYYEVLCPFCKNLINGSVAELWNDDEFRKRIDLKFYPFGNAMAINKKKVSDGYKFWHEELNVSGFDYVFACQHGQEECFGNTLQNCAMNLLGKQKKYVPFIMCMEGYNEEASLEMASYDCASQLKIDMVPIRECTRSSEGNKVMLEIGEVTQGLNPPHEYVPWVTLNGKHSQASEQDADKGKGNLLREVCNKLTEPKPKLCPSMSTHTSFLKR